MIKLLRFLFHYLIAKPLVLLMLGINIRDGEHLPASGPAIIVANHNSHLDTLALMSLFSYSLLDHVHPVAAADYYMTNKYLRWFAINIIGIIPIERYPTDKDHNVFTPLLEALDNNAILILFPEGSRGEPEKMGKLKNGIGRLVKERPHVPVIPVFFYGLGKALPKGEFLLIPFFIDAFVGEAIYWQNSRVDFMETLIQKMAILQSKAAQTQ
jgi:1-acyl-sn-glycerol-3-phosphate acyltransferase